SLDSMNAKMESFMLDNTPLETGINIYYPFVAAQLYNTGSDSAFVMDKIQIYLDVLEKNIIDTEIKDDDPRDIEQLKYYQSVISYLKVKNYIKEENGLMEQLNEMEEIIKERLLEFPVIDFS
ncbi:MAG: hypothetical protein ACP5E3_05895, partial [Bacteroidales bacterium]